MAVLGRDLMRWKGDYYEHVGVSFELPNHYVKLTALENLALFASLYGTPVESPKVVLEAVGLLEHADKLVAQPSQGMKVRLNLARALLNQPRLLFLDERTAGLDPVTAKAIRALIRQQHDAGVTVFLTTHDMAVADALCTASRSLSTARFASSIVRLCSGGVMADERYGSRREANRPYTSFSLRVSLTTPRSWFCCALRPADGAHARNHARRSLRASDREVAHLRRVTAMLRWEARLRRRCLFYAATAIVAAIWVVLLRLLPAEVRANPAAFVAPALVGFADNKVSGLAIARLVSAASNLALLRYRAVLDP